MSRINAVETPLHWNFVVRSISGRLRRAADLSIFTYFYSSIYETIAGHVNVGSACLFRSQSVEAMCVH